MRYPKCKQAGIAVSLSEHNTPHVTPAALMIGLIGNKLPRKPFDKLSKIPINGEECYLAWDVEMALTPLLKTEQQKRDEEIINLFKKK